MDRFEIQPVVCSALSDVAAFLEQQLSLKPEFSSVKPACSQSALSTERRLRWLLLENPSATKGTPHGYCVRDESGAIRGLNLAFPATFLAADQRIRGLGSGSFFVDPPARSLGFYLFKKYLGIKGYSFHFASTCNAVSSELWRNAGGRAVPGSETEYVLPLQLDVMLPAFVASRTRSRSAVRLARLCGRTADQALRILTRPSTSLTIEPCQDWKMLSELSFRHRSAKHVTSERTVEYLEWRYGPASPLFPCGVYLVTDRRGNQGWFAVGDLSRGKTAPFRESALLDVIWPENRMDFKSLFQAILRVAADGADSIFFRGRPGFDFSEFRPWAIRRRLPAPRAFVITPKGTPQMPVDSLEYDDSDYIAWRFD
jgi:hypothetical protein